MEQKIIYLRVSKKDLKGEEEQQDIEAQLPPILKKYSLNEANCIILRDKGSAYDVDKLKDRTEFLAMIQLCFNAEKTTLNDLFLNHYTKKDISLYVYDYNRIVRNIEFGMLFALLCYWFNVNVYSCNQENLNCNTDDQLGTKIARYLMLTVNSYLAEGYSKNISDAVKKSIKQDTQITTSRDGNKWGRYFTDENGDKIKVSPLKAKQIEDSILRMIKYYENLNMKYYLNTIIDRIKEEFKIKISKTYVIKLRDKNGRN